MDGGSKRDRPIKLWDQEKLNDIARDLGLTKDAEEYLASNLKKDTHVLQLFEIGKNTFFLFSRKNNLSSTAHVSENFLKLNIYRSEEWR